METTRNDPVHNGPVHLGRRVAWGRLIPVGLLAAIVAVGANAAVYFVAAGAGAMPQDVLANGRYPVTLAPVAIMSAFGAVAGSLLYALVGRFVRRPVRVFRAAALVALLISFVWPFTLPGAPISMIVVLCLMHVLAAAVVVGLLTTLAAREA